MTNEKVLVKVFTEIFKTLGELQRCADELETTGGKECN